MPMQVVNGSQSFGPVSGTGPQSSVQTITLPSAGGFGAAAAILTGFIVEFSHGDDHHLGQLDVQVQVQGISGQDVQVQVTYGLRDWSGNWDDAYDGTVFFTVVAE